MQINILGICGTFMGGIAVLARQAGYKVSGCDANVYPPMSTQLESQNIILKQGFKAEYLNDDDDEVIVGNVMSRGNEVVEAMLNKGMKYNSGPQWLYENVLKDRWVLAVSGTHGKTTTSSILAWILEYAGLNPGFLIGGVAANFGISARLGDGPFFVVEADEYDTAFFDKRSKFLHYHPRTLILNNLEFDHADIFDDLDAIKKQFHHLIRTVPSEGLLISNANEKNLDDVLEQGCWSQLEKFSDENNKAWLITNVSDDGRRFDIELDGEHMGRVESLMLGRHNRMNILAAIIAARHAGVPVEQSIEAMTEFKGVKRRMELRGTVNGIAVYDDFAHHPTAITETLEGLRAAVGKAKIWAVLEPRSNTMRLGVHKNAIANALKEADFCLLYQPENMSWDLQTVVNELPEKGSLYKQVDAIVAHLKNNVQAGEHIVVMSNGSFDGIHQKILDAFNR